MCAVLLEKDELGAHPVSDRRVYKAGDASTATSLKLRR